MRLPDGDLRLITNWPASVRGKKATPSSGNNNRLATNSPVMATTTRPGRFSDERTVARTSRADG